MANAAREGGVPFPYAAAAKVVSTQTCMDIAHEAITMFGGYGLCREYPLEKLFRDARPPLIEDGENTMLALIAVSHF